MYTRSLAIFTALAMCSSMACRDKAKRKPMAVELPHWIPLEGVPLPGHGGNRHVVDPSVRQLTTEELITIAYRYHPQLGDSDDYTIEAWDEAFWKSPEQVALSLVQYRGYARLSVWQELCNAVARSIPSGFIVADRTYPRYYPTYVIVVDAPMEPGSNVEKTLLVHLSYLIPYYFYYELHSWRVKGEEHEALIARMEPSHAASHRRVNKLLGNPGLLQRAPLLYEVTPVFEPVLAAIEREIDRRYGYWRMSPEVAHIYVPGIYINGYHDWEEHPPTLQDALFTPHRW